MSVVTVKNRGYKVPFKLSDVLLETLEHRNQLLEEYRLQLGGGSVSYLNHTETPRDPLRSNLLKLLYKYKCQICDKRIETSPGKYTCHTHHLFQVGDGGPDDLANMMVVCPNCHIMLDKGALYLDIDFDRVLHFRTNHELHRKSINIKHYIDEYYVGVQNDRYRTN
ncbi:HNH endonuclease [Litchfieldia alkalitelluris]|uniref:HNH endonuclease n=1 Tax=Litchfieldia alkalitelluris TaxID=304268 RepID=UPI0014731396|nr:HNH endonuclease [Litchfieldia alkalitelluris]